MTIYVDNAFIKARVGRLDTRWCHMTSDKSIEELKTFAQNIGLLVDWFQTGWDKMGKRGSEPGPGAVVRGFWHFDVTPGVRAKAVANGAVECTSREMLDIMTREGRELT